MIIRNVGYESISRIKKKKQNVQADRAERIHSRHLNFVVIIYLDKSIYF
jgi:hypothetical protein